MTQFETSPLFTELGPDNYILTSEETVALEAAWKVLQGFEIVQYGNTRFYTDDDKESTLDYLREGEEERPLNIFALVVRESDTPDQFDVQVFNNNGRGNPDYRQTLRQAIATVGIEKPAE